MSVCKHVCICIDRTIWQRVLGMQHQVCRSLLLSTLDPSSSAEGDNSISCSLFLYLLQLLCRFFLFNIYIHVIFSLLEITPLVSILRDSFSQSWKKWSFSISSLSIHFTPPLHPERGGAMRESSMGKGWRRGKKRERGGAEKEAIVSHSLLTHYIGTALAKVIRDLLVVKSNY